MSAPFFLVILHDAKKGADWVMEHPLYLSAEACAIAIANGESSVDWPQEDIARIVRVDVAAGVSEDVTDEVADLAAQYTIDKGFEPDAITMRFFNRLKLDFYVEGEAQGGGRFHVRGMPGNPHWVP